MELVRFPSRGGFSVRSIFTFALTVLVTALLWVVLASAPTHAVDAQWNGSALLYEGNQYTYAGEAEAGQLPGIAEKSPYYVYSPSTPTTGSAGQNSSYKAYVIYFAPGVSPPASASANYAEYTYNATTKVFTSPTNQQEITLNTDSANSGGTACAIEGIGWLACPAMTWLAAGMDGIFDIIAGFMEVQPLQTGNTTGTLYQTWNTMRGIANIAFIIVFIIIIYSQLTNIQVNSYGLKKLLPRLIIAAVAVNVSYFIAAVAVDISNILGYSIEDLLIGMQQQVVAGGTVDPANQADLNSGASWAAFTAFIISGGTAAAVGIVGALTVSGGMLTAIAFLLLPTLVGLILALLVVFLILAARQALIIILVIIAPIAIVAYLLPNTEKWFDKWRGLFMTMLIFFPAFAFVFGGAQLAGSIIIKNANSVTMQLLGMAVQVAPLVITPLILKFSGGVLGNIARIVNNPNKGLIDRTRNWSKSHADWHRSRGTGGLDRNGNPIPGGLTGRNFARRSARYLDQRKRRRGDRTSNAETATQTAYENSPLYSKTRRNGSVKYDMAVQKAALEADKNITHNRHAAHVEHSKISPGSMMYNRAIDEQVSKDSLETAQARTNTHFNTQRTIGGSALNRSMINNEVGKARLEISENDKNIYISEQRQQRGTQLNAVVDTLESSKLHLEGSQQRYTAMVDTMKTDPSNALYLASQAAQAGKDHAEAAQNRVQAMFDDLRVTERAPGDPTPNVLNVAARDLASSKVIAERGQSEVSAYLNTLKATPGSTLHLQTVAADKAKRDAQLAESKLSRILDEYRAGGERDAAGNILINGTAISYAEEVLLRDMVAQTEDLAAEAQGAQAAQNMQKKRIAEAFTETEDYTDPADGKVKKRKTARAAALLNIAKSIDEYGDVRAEATALSTLEDITNKARTANETLLEERAVAAGLMPKDYAVELLRARAEDNDMSESEDLIRAAMEIAGKEAQIPIIRKMRKSKNFNQDHLTAMLLRNSGTMKVKGGFDLQADPGLIHASDELMNASIAGTLGSTAAEQFKDLKNGAIKDYARNMDTILSDTKLMEGSSDANEQKYGRNGIEGIQKTYYNLTLALNDEQLVRGLGDNLIPAIQMHKKIHDDPRFHNPAMNVDYATIDPQNLSGVL